MHYFLSHGWLSLFYYEVYQLPSCLLALISIAGITATRTPKIFRIICIGTTVALAILWFARQTIHVSFPNDIRIWIALAGTTVGLALLRPRITSAPVLLVGLLLSTSAMFMWQPIVAYPSWPGGASTAELERDVYSGAVFLQKFVRAHVRPPASIGFWYSNASENVNLNSMQSMFLWHYSRVQGATGPGMPQIDDAVRQSVQRQPFIAILARSDKEVDDAYSALKTVPIHFIEVARANYSATFEFIRRHYCETCSNSASVVTRIGENP